jgi:hypothetical protein
MLRRALAVPALAGALLLFPGAAAAADGPCGCTKPAATEAGRRLRTQEAAKVIWNPAPRDFGAQSVPEDLASGYRADAPSKVVRDRSRPASPASFRVPEGTPPGLYFVLISRGGSRTTWDYVQVRGRPAAEGEGSGASGSSGGGGQGRLALAFGVGVVASLVSLLLLRRRHTRTG